LTFYQAFVLGPKATNTGQAAISKSISGVETQIGPNAVINTTVGDIFRLEVSGSNPPVLSLYQRHAGQNGNGWLILQVQDYSNAIPSGGSPGIKLFDSVAANRVQVSGFAAGNTGVIPAYVPTVYVFPRKGASIALPIPPGMTAEQYIMQLRSQKYIISSDGITFIPTRSILKMVPS
jgi:hypothetical protein